jgi:hypothetical protein
VRFSASATSAPVELAAVINALPEFAARWRALRFDGGTLVMDDGSANGGLTVEAGAHPIAGVRYRVVMPDRRSQDVTTEDRAALARRLKRGGDREEVGREWARERRERVRAARDVLIWLVELSDDDAKHIRIRIHDPEAQSRTEVEVTRPNRPERIEVTWVGDNKGRWITRGSVTVEVHADLATLTTGARPHRLLSVRVRHRHARASARVDVDTSSSTQWTTSLEARARGAGALRPVVAFASPLVRRVAARQLQKAVREFPAKIDELNRDLTTRFGDPPSPERIAEVALHDLLHDLVRSPPESH